MTPADLARAWPDGVPAAGRITLTLDPRAAAVNALHGVLIERLRGIAGSLTKAFALVEADFTLDVTPQPVDGQTWPIDFAFSRPATDAMAYFLTAVETVAEEAGGGLFTHVDIDAAARTVLANRRILPDSGLPPVADASGQPISADAARRMVGAALYLAIPRQAAPAPDTCMTAMLALSALMEEGCFGALDHENDLSSPLVGHDPDGREMHIGVTGYRGDPGVGAALGGLVAHLCGGALPRGTRLVLAHEDTV